MAVSLEQFSMLVSDIYRAAVDASLWEPTMEALLAALGGHGGALLVAEPGSRRFRSTAIGMDSAGVASYESHYGNMDPVPPILARARVGNVLAGSQIARPDEHRRTEFYNDWAKPFGTGDGMFTSLVKDDDGLSWFCCSAPLCDEPFATPDRLRLMRLIVPHLQQALGTQQKLGEAMAVRDRMLDALEYARHGVAWLTQGGAVVHANGAATAICRTGEGLAISKGHLRAFRSRENAELQRLIGAATVGDSDGVRSGGCLSISRREGIRPLVLHVMPLAPDTPSFCARDGAALVVIVDIDDRVEGRPEILRDLYGLTPAEAVVATAMLRHDSLESIARELDISISTVRTHMQRVYGKLGVHRQSDVVRVVQTIHADLVARPIGRKNA